MDPSKNKEDDVSGAHIPWHPAFVAAIQLELEAYQDSLEFFPEYPLTTEPLKIDCVIIKKAADVKIDKNIAAIFREINILEYKSPDDYISIADFYKVYGYACLYMYLNDISISNLTISFIESHYPKRLLEHLAKARAYKVEETTPGIYTVCGDIFPIQIIDNRHLSEEKTLWLKYLSNRLDPLAVIKISNEAVKRDKNARIKAYLYAITQANVHAIKEAITMSNDVLTLDEVIESTGMAARLEAKAEERKAIDIAQNMIDLGLPLETIVSATELDPEKVKELFQSNES